MHLIETNYKRNVMQINKYTKIKNMASLIINCMQLYAFNTN